MDSFRASQVTVLCLPEDFTVVPLPRMFLGFPQIIVFSVVSLQLHSLKNCSSSYNCTSLVDVFSCMALMIVLKIFT